MENIEADKPNTLDTSQSSQGLQIQMTKDTKELTFEEQTENDLSLENKDTCFFFFLIMFLIV